jgi:hypothetical protein
MTRSGARPSSSPAAVHTRRQTTGVGLGHPPHAQERVGARPHHQLLQVADPCEVPRVRRREDPLPQPPYVILDPPPVDGVPVKGASFGPFTTTVAVASNLSSGCGASVIFLLTGSPDRVSALSRPGTRPGIRSVIRNDRLEEAAILSRFSAAFRLPAFASRSSDSRRGVGPSLRSAYRTWVRTSTGLPRSARVSCGRGGCPLYPGDGGALPGQVVSLTGACRFAAASPCTPLRHPIARGSASRGINEGSSHSPVRPFPSPVAARMERAPSGFPPGFAPRRPGADDARRGGDRPSSTDLELLAQHHIRVDPPIV